MLLRDFLNEFQLDWAQAALRSELIPVKKLNKKKVLLIGEAEDLKQAIAWSFMAFNDKHRAGICVQEAVLEHCPEETLDNAQWEKSKEEVLQLTAKTLYAGEAFAPETADYVILTGLSNQQISQNTAERMAYLKEFQELLQTLAKNKCERILLLSDGRVYGKLEKDFAASEYEEGYCDPCSSACADTFLLKTMEAYFAEIMKAENVSWNILRPGRLYGPYINALEHPVASMTEQVARGAQIHLELSSDKSTYISIHDMLTAVQFILTRCPANKIFNAAGPASTLSEGEIAMMLYQNFPDQCKLTLTTGTDLEEVGSGEMTEIFAEILTPESDTDQAQAEPEEDAEALYPCWLNTQLLEHYGFTPKVPLEDGLIIMVKSQQNTGEVFIFDNTYMGKLSKVQQILLGYLLEIDRICKKHDIKYFLAGGTLLGAIRHHGFIPWDDDADVMMLREDYEKFQKVAKDELPENIFLQLPHTEKGNFNPFTKLRINNTMFATEFTGHFMDMHNGIFFDILSHDRSGNHKWSQKLHLMITMLTRSVVFNKWGDTDIKGGGAHPIICKIVDRVKYLIPMPLALWAQEHSLRFFEKRKTAYLYDGMGRNLNRGAFPAEWLAEAVEVDFEGYKFPVPKEYHKYLTWLYGDYMQMIPVSQRRTSHSIVLMDLGSYGAYKIKE